MRGAESMKNQQTARAYLFEYDYETSTPKEPRFVEVAYEDGEPTLESLRSFLDEDVNLVEAVRVNRFATIWIDEEGRLKEPAYVNIFVRNARDEVFDLCRTCIMVLDNPAPTGQGSRLKASAEELILGLYTIVHVRPGGPARAAEEPRIEITPWPAGSMN